jgi:hypothetical protein
VLLLALCTGLGFPRIRSYRPEFRLKSGHLDRLRARQLSVPAAGGFDLPPEPGPTAGELAGMDSMTAAAYTRGGKLAAVTVLADALIAAGGGRVAELSPPDQHARSIITAALQARQQTRPGGSDEVGQEFLIYADEIAAAIGSTDVQLLLHCMAEISVRLLLWLADEVHGGDADDLWSMCAERMAVTSNSGGCDPAPAA